MNPADYYDGSFGGTDFWEQTSGGFAAEHTEEEDAAITHIPGGDKVVVQSAGRAARLLDLPVVVAGAELDDLRDSRGDSGSLVYSGGTRTARLLGIKWRKAWGDVYQVSLKLVLT